jgi:macrolide transport system ATP-binding/permease protein
MGMSSVVSTIREWVVRLWQTLRPGRDDGDLRDELRLHLELAAADARHGSDAPETAARSARIQEGPLGPAIEMLRDQRGLPWLDDLRSDLRFGLRGLARNRGFTIAAALTLAVGSGGTTAMFSIANAMLFRPFPAPHPEELVVVAQLDEHTTVFPHDLSYPEYVDYRDLNQVFDGLAAFDSDRPILTASETAGPVRVEYVSRNFFDVLRVDAAVGRTFLPSEGREPGDAPVVVLSHRVWQNRFGADPSVVGRVVRLGSTEHTVVGVTPEWFVFTDGNLAAELYTPITQIGLVRAGRGDVLTNRRSEEFQLIGRLREGVTLTEARANLDVVTAALATEYPDSMERSSLWVEAERRARPMPANAPFTPLFLAMVMTLASLVLVMACANVGTLLISRGAGRQRELALRAGLGATRWRLVRQLISESLLLALLGGVAGTAAALWATDVLSAIVFAPAEGGVTIDVTMDWRVLAFSAVLAALTGLIAGVAPAWKATRVDLSRAIGTGAHGASGRVSGRRLTSGLVVAQVSISLVLLVCAGLFIRSGQNAATLDVGFRTDHVLLASVDPLGQGYTRDETRRLFRDIAADVEALSGVRSASWASEAPQLGVSGMTVVTLDGGAIPETAPLSVYANEVDAAFFDTIGLPVILGRGFVDEDVVEGRAVAVISEAAAQRFWPGDDPLGKRFVKSEAPQRPIEVVGVVRDARLSFFSSQIPITVLVPFGRRLTNAATLHIHTEGPPLALAAAASEAVRRHGPELAVYGLTSMERHLRAGVLLASVRLAAWVFGGFGALGLLLATVGLYGVVAYSVTQRMQEFGIRTALGASPVKVVRLAAGKGMALTVGGIAVGFLGASAVTPFMAGFLVNVDVMDPIVFGATSLLLAGVALLACLVPSRRATKADPLATLKAD